ncbi:hypothetical protein DFQ13_103185 [Actinokineospora spheciospongiae]|nr:hypothetical protein DFQ13_103185 [Actinokineospora spheciospongiae]
MTGRVRYGWFAPVRGRTAYALSVAKGESARRDTTLVVLVVLLLFSTPFVIAGIRFLATHGGEPPVSAPATTTTTAADAPIPWTAEEAVRALADDHVARLPGAPAVVDEGRVRPELERAGWKLLLLPFSGTDSRDRHRDELRRLRDEHGGDRLVVVSGLRVEVGRSHRLIGPENMAEVAAVLGTADLTESVLTALAEDRPHAEPAAPVPAEAAQVERVAADLAARSVHTGPGVPAAEEDERWSRAGPDLAVRIAVLPAGPATDLVHRLGARFPRDLVVVVRGRWVDMAGPEPDVARTARDAYYGQNFFRLAEWGPDPLRLGSLLVEEVGGTRAARAAALVAPSADAGPPAWATAVAPWAFAGAAVLLVGVPVALRHRPSRLRRERAVAERVARNRLAAEVTALAGEIARLDGLARDGRAADLVTSATERYGAARDLLAADGDLPTARGAARTARDQLTEAAGLLGVAP